MEIKNPATGAKLYDLNAATSGDIQQAFATARKVQKKIAAMSPKARVSEVIKISDYLVEHYDQVVDRIVAETGKTRFEALSNEIFEICDGIDYFRDRAPKILEDKKVHTPLLLMGKKSKIVHEPLGVVAIIAPWNYPLIQCFTPSILAFLAGNAVIFKPSEVTPLHGLYEEIMKGAEFMKDAIQVVYGGKDVGAALIRHKPDKIHFTGSTRAGKQIMAAAADHLIPVDLELGGKDPAIVFDDVDIEKTANGIAWGAFTNAGQSCTSIERCYVHESIYQPFLEELKRITGKMRLPADPKDMNTCDMGCMTADFQLEIVEKQLKDAVGKGAHIETGGKKMNDSMLFPPTILSGVTEDMAIAQEETFGPVLPLLTFQSEEEVIDRANESEYGLSASVWTKDLKRAERVAKALKVGNVAINNHMLTEANPALPFGGIKQSGFGRYKGDWGITTFSNIKSIISGPNNKVIEPHWYPFTQTKYALFPKMMKAFFRRPRNWFGFAKTGLKLDTLGTKEKIQ